MTIDSDADRYAMTTATAIRPPVAKQPSRQLTHFPALGTISAWRPCLSLIVASLVWLFPAHAAQASSTESPSGQQHAAFIEQAQAAVTDLSRALQAELAQAVQAGGTASAISFCNLRALPLTHQIADAHQMEVRRVTLQPRNPANRAAGWEEQVLQEFTDRMATGADPAQLHFVSEQALAEGAHPGANELRYMQAILMAPPCLQCHGSAIDADVRQRLAALYPDDEATGYAAGDLRGGFVVTTAVPRN